MAVLDGAVESRAHPHGEFCFSRVLNVPDSPEPCSIRRTPVPGPGRLSTHLWFLSVLFVIYGTTIPFRFVGDIDHAVAKWSSITFHPLISPDTGQRVSIPDVVQNLLLFLPFGVFGMASLGRRRTPMVRVVLVTALGMLLAACVEVLQLFTADRTSSLADLLANTIGALGGAVAGPLALGGFKRAMGQLKSIGGAGAPAFYPLLVATAVLAVAALEPFDLTLDPGSVWAKAKAFIADPWQAGLPTDEALEFLRYLLFTIMLASWLRQLGVPGHKAVSLGVGLMVVVLLEGAQIFIASRMPGLTDVLVHAAGVAGGAALFTPLRHLRSPWSWVGLLTLATAAGAAMQMLSPFSLAADPQPIQWVPFLNYYEHTRLDTVSHIAAIMLTFFPPGFAVAQLRCSPGRLWMIAIACTLGVSVPLEGLQGWIAGRYPDVTDVGISVLGGAAGMWAGGPGWARFTAMLESFEDDGPAPGLHRPGDG